MEIKSVALKKIGKASESSLSFLELGKEINFPIKRIYYIYNMKKFEVRGFHAHKNLKQAFFCPYGGIKMEFNDGLNRKDYILDDPSKLLVIEKGYWREFTALKDGSVLCVIASEKYDESDYIREYNKYLEWLEVSNENTI